MTAPGGSTPRTAWLSFEEAANRIGRHVWLEERLFELLGRLVPRLEEPALKLLAAEQSRHHAWHAELWRALLPVSRGFHAESFVTAPPEHETRFGTLPPDPRQALAGVYGELLPALIDDYRRHLEVARPVSDGPAIRTLGLVLTDEVADQRAGEAALASIRP